MPESLTALRREPVIMHESDKQRLALSRLLPAYTCKVRDLNTAIITLLKLIIMGFIKKKYISKTITPTKFHPFFAVWLVGAEWTVWVSPSTPAILIYLCVAALSAKGLSHR